MNFANRRHQQWRSTHEASVDEEDVDQGEPLSSILFGYHPSILLSYHRESTRRLLLKTSIVLRIKLIRLNRRFHPGTASSPTFAFVSAPNFTEILNNRVGETGEWNRDGDGSFDF